MKHSPKRTGRTRSLVAACLLLVSAGSQAAAPAGRYTLTTDTVTDTATGLVWQRTAPLTTYTWFDAMSYCQSLSLAGLSDGWRVPTIKELQSIIDVRVMNPSMDPTAFPNAPADYVWSSSTVGTGTSSAFAVVFGYGYTVRYGTTILSRVRCVR